MSGGVTNDEAARKALMERRKLAGDILPFSPAQPRDSTEYDITPRPWCGQI